jgi:hypothetical protein
MHTRKGLDIKGQKIFKTLKPPSTMKQNMNANSSKITVASERNCAHNETHYIPKYTPHIKVVGQVAQ